MQSKGLPHSRLWTVSHYMQACSNVTHLNQDKSSAVCALPSEPADSESVPLHAGVLKSKTRLLVTNQLQFVPQADRVVYLEAGCVAAQGSFEEVSQHPGFASLLTEFNAKAEAEEVRQEPLHRPQLCPQVSQGLATQLTD